MCSVSSYGIPPTRNLEECRQKTHREKIWTATTPEESAALRTPAWMPSSLPASKPGEHRCFIPPCCGTIPVQALFSSYLSSRTSQSGGYRRGGIADASRRSRRHGLGAEAVQWEQYSCACEGVRRQPPSSQVLREKKAGHHRVTRASPRETSDGTHNRLLES